MVDVLNSALPSIVTVTSVAELTAVIVPHVQVATLPPVSLVGTTPPALVPKDRPGKDPDAPTVVNEAAPLTPAKPLTAGVHTVGESGGEFPVVLPVAAQ